MAGRPAIIRTFGAIEIPTSPTPQVHMAASVTFKKGGSIAKNCSSVIQHQRNYIILKTT